MPEYIKLSELVEEIQVTLQERFDGEVHWISARIMNVRKQESNRRCYLTLEEHVNGVKVAEVRSVFWANCYHEIEKFEKQTKQVFRDGAEIICKVRVRYHKVYGLNLDIMQIDVAHTLGALELERQKTLERLLKENPRTIQLFDGAYKTYNNRLPLPGIISNIALVTASNSDGQRDFQQELKHNKHQYSFNVTEYLTTIQGEGASGLILSQLKAIERNKEMFDLVVIVRGGGSQGDFKPFDDYDLARCVATFPLPIFTGIGHDRNQSIVDLMAREFKTPTKVAASCVDHNFTFENSLIELKDRFFEAIEMRLEEATEDLANAKRVVKLSSPKAILDRGFAIIKSGDKILVDPKQIKENSELQTLLKNEIIYSKVTKKKRNENQSDI